MRNNYSDSVVGGLVALLVFTIITATVLIDRTRVHSYAAGQEKAARKVIFAYPGTEKSVALEFVLDKSQMLAAEEALKP
jgi:hypothetical protein